jgi:hypothetical protein
VEEEFDHGRALSYTLSGWLHEKQSDEHGLPVERPGESHLVAGSGIHQESGRES